MGIKLSPIKPMTEEKNSTAVLKEDSAQLPPTELAFTQRQQTIY